jgi:RNA polymerase sigma-70 factor (ECF subfamily)
MRRWLAALALACVPVLADAQTITVGSKRFTESYILGEILAQTMRGAEAARVNHSQGLGNTAIVFTALRNGSIDLYPEYTGTIAFELLNRKDAAGMRQLADALQAYGLGVAIPLGFNNTYALAMQEKRAVELGLARISQLAARLLSRFIRDATEVEDVTQEAFIKAYRALPSFRGDSAFYTWLYRIGINTAKNYLVALGRRAPTTTDIDSEEAEGFEDGDQLRDLNTPENQMMSRQVAETVNQTLEELPEELRTAITLREIEGLSYEDIANIMNCPIGTVRSRIFRAREAIAERLRPLLGTSKDRRW